MKNNIKGFTLIEVLIVIGLMGILMTVAYPSFSQWQKNAQFKTAARQLAGAMMEARSRAISTNLVHEISFDLGANTYKLSELQGGVLVVPPIYENQSVAANIDIKAKVPSPLPSPLSLSDCTDNTDNNYRFRFLPNGTFNVVGGSVDGDNFICIVDKASDVTEFNVGVPAATTGRVVLIK